MYSWVNLTSGSPILADFLSTNGQGSPICIDTSTQRAYYLASGNIITELAGGGGSFVATTADVAAADTSNPVILTQSGREGLFVFNNSDLSTFVAADTVEGIYIAPDSDPDGSSGAWVRRFDGPINPLWFGIIEGNSAGANGAANSTAFDVLLAVLRLRAPYENFVYRGLEPILFPAGYFEFSSTIEITNGAGIIEGCDPGFSQTRATILKFPSGVTGIRVQRFNTSGATTTDGVTHFAGDGFTIRNIALFGAYTTTEAEVHGIHLRARANIENVDIEEFEGDGIYGNATAGGAPEGNANNTRITNVRCRSNRNGIFIDGADANIWSVISADCADNRQWGIWDSSFLGNTYLGCHASTNGVTVGAITSMVSHGGQRYVVKVGQAVGASTNAPSGTSADNTWWRHVGAGGPLTVSANIPDWTNGISVREGGSYCTDNGNSKGVFVGCYHEGGYGLPQLSTRTLIFGGFMATYVAGGAGALITAENNFIKTETGFLYESYDTSTSTFSVQIGNGANKIALVIEDSVAAPSEWSLRLVNSDLDLAWAYSGSNIAYYITGVATAQQFGTGAAVAHAFHPPKLMVGSSITNARQITNGTAAPTTGAHARGEIVFNRDQSAGGVVAWLCTAAGTPGTWVELRGGGVTSTTSAFNTITPTFNDSVVTRDGASGNVNFANPTGTAIDGKEIILRLRDNGSARTIAFGTNYRAMGVTLPATTIASKWIILRMVYNSIDTKWDVIAVLQEA